MVKEQRTNLSCHCQEPSLLFGEVPSSGQGDNLLCVVVVVVAPHCLLQGERAQAEERGFPRSGSSTEAN